MDFVADHPILRFENHNSSRLGKAQRRAFNRHFQFGGRDGIPGKPWTHQKWRPDAPGDWRVFQATRRANTRCSTSPAVSRATNPPVFHRASEGRRSSAGLPLLGYADAAALFAAFKQSERWHVCGFFDFCEGNGLHRSSPEAGIGGVRGRLQWQRPGGELGANIKAAFDAGTGIVGG